jgi:hypothetical protein
MSRQNSDAPAVATESIEDIAAARVAATSSPTSPGGSMLRARVREASMIARGGASCEPLLSS